MYIYFTSDYRKIRGNVPDFSIPKPLFLYQFNEKKDEYVKVNDDIVLLGRN